MTKSIEILRGFLANVTWRLHACSLVLMLAMLAILPEPAPSQQSRFTFQHISIEQGLSHASINTIMQDSRGFLWIGTDYGLNRYDGRTFKVFIHDPTDSLSLSGTTVTAIYEDHFKTLWIGTQSGLNRFDYLSETFKHYIPISGDLNSISHANIRAITQSSHDTSSLWISTGKGLNKLDLKTGKFTRFLHDPANPNTLSINDLRFILENDSGFFWIGTWEYGVNRFDPRSLEAPVFTRYNHDPANPYSIGANSVRVGAKDSLGTLWFGTWSGGGIYKYNPQSSQFTRFQPEKYNPNSIFRNSITYLFIDSNGIIWICDGVLIRFNPRDKSLLPIKFHPNQGSNPNSYTPITVYEDRSHNLWIGTGSGLYKIDLKSQKYRHYTHQAEEPTSLIDDDIQLFHEDRQGMLWIAARNSGLDRFDPAQETFKHFKHDPTNQHSLNHNTVQVLFDDSDGFTWAGTPAGLNRIDPHEPR